MLRIAHVITRLIQGGADENTLLSCNGQAALGHEVHLIFGAEVSPAMVGRLHPLVRPHQISDLWRAVAPVRDARATWSLAALLRRVRPQILHTHTSKAGAVGRVAARLAGIPGVVHGIHILPFLNVGRAERAAYLATERLLAPVTDKFVSVSRGMLDSAVAHGIGPARKHVVIPSGMDLDQFRRATPVVDRRSGPGLWLRDAAGGGSEADRHGRCTRAAQEGGGLPRRVRAGGRSGAARGPGRPRRRPRTGRHPQPRRRPGVDRPRRVARLPHRRRALDRPGGRLRARVGARGPAARRRAVRAGGAPDGRDRPAGPRRAGAGRPQRIPRAGRAPRPHGAADRAPAGRSAARRRRWPRPRGASTCPRGAPATWSTGSKTSIGRSWPPSRRRP